MESLPRSFGKYELLERIATGGMAEVYLARSFGVAGFEKRLVVKRIRPELEDNPRFVQMFINEAKIGVQLDHPNIVQVYELGKVEGSHYIVMEHLAGRDFTRLKKTMTPLGQRLDLPVAVWVVAEVCRGLAHAHTRASGEQKGIIHRDVSPHNIVGTFAGQVKLVDFGIARLMHDAAPGHLETRPGPGGGKYAYMSPEQAMGEAVDHRTDIFSAGIVLWELIVGHRLYQHADPAEKLRRVQRAVVSHPSEEGAEIDEGLWDILKRALMRYPDDRYPSAALFEEDLRAWLFETRNRVEPKALADVLAGYFPEEAVRRSGVSDLAHMVADVERLDPAETSATPHPVATPDSPMPGRLRPSAGERKQVAVVFVDVDGLTQLSERIEPEALFRRHFQLLRWTRRIVDKYGGILQRAVDDQLVLLFGVPLTRLDDNLRAVECALELQRRADGLRGALGAPVGLAIGIHIGEVTVNMVRHRVRYEARGDTTRLARRLSGVADQGEVLASQRVVERVGASFRTSLGPPVPSRKGQPPLPSFRVEERREGLRVSGKGAWIRRGDEIAQIRDALLRLLHGEKVHVLLVGDTGSGKTRLIREIRDIASRRGIPFYGTRCTSVGDHILWDAFRSILSDVTGQEAEPLAHLGLPRHQVQALQGFLGGAPTPEPVDVSELVAGIFTSLAATGPMILALENVHHIERFGGLSTVLATVRGPVLFLLTSAPPGPDLDLPVTRVQLGPFPPAAQLRLVRELLEVDEVATEVAELLERTCEGNPLYLQEMVNYLVNEKRLGVVNGEARLVGDTETKLLPDSLAAVMSARIDALDPASKGVLQLAAVAGAAFDVRVVGEAAGVEATAPLIADLAGNGLIVRASGPEERWAFASELVREAALRGCLGVQRRDHHRLVAGALEKVHADQLDAHSAEIAEHCAEGGRPLDAARYAYAGGEYLEQRQDLHRARRIYDLGLRWIGRMKRTSDDYDAIVQGEAMLHLRLGVVELLLGEIAEGERHLQVALDVSSDTGLPWIEIRAHLELGRSFLQRGKYRLAGAHLSQVRGLLRIEKDRDLELDTLEALAVLAHEEGRNDDAEALWRQSLERAEGDHKALARCLLGLANRHLRAGRHGDAAPLLESALEHTVVAGDRILEGRVLNNIGLLHSWAGRHEEALAYYRNALQVREGIGYTRGVVINHHNIGDVHFSREDWARAWVAFSRSKELAAKMGWERGIVLNDVYLTYIASTRGDGSVDELSAAVARADELGDHEIATTGRWLAARYWIAKGDRERANAELETAMAVARSQGLSAMESRLKDVRSSVPE